MRTAVRTILLVPACLWFVACGATRERDDTRESDGRETQEGAATSGDDHPDRNGHGTVVTKGGGGREIMNFMVGPVEGGGGGGGGGDAAVIKVWIGGAACPPDPGDAPTYDSEDIVALPWRPGVRVALSEEDVDENGEFTVYTLVIEPIGDGCFCVSESCEVVEVPPEGERRDFTFTIARSQDTPNFRLVTAAREAVRAGN